MSLRRRVVIGFALVAAVLVLTNIVLSSTFHGFLLNRVDDQLETAVSSLTNRPRSGPGPAGQGQPVQPGRGLQGDAFTEYYIAVAPTGGAAFSRVGFGPDEKSPPALDPSEVAEHMVRRPQRPEPFTAGAQSGRGSWRLVAIATAAGTVTVIGLSLDELHATLARTRFVQLAGTAAVLAALGLVSWWMLRLGVHPLTAMAKTADAIAGGDLSHRVEHPDERTEAGRLGAALNAMLARIEEAFRAQEASEARVRRFAADASHELRTPLTSIQGYAELWRAGGLRTDEELAEAMRRMEQEGKRMASLVEDLLLLARLDQRRPLEQAGVRLDEIAADAVRDARAVEPERPIELDVDSGPVMVEGDEMRLRQVLANLLANARMHTPPDTQVVVSARATGTVARLVVADDGPGMAPEVAAKVFERFYRADPSRTRSAGGAGLGLAIVAAIAEAHGGRAWVESEQGRGSRFIVELPAFRDSASVSQPVHRIKAHHSK